MLSFWRGGVHYEILDCYYVELSRKRVVIPPTPEDLAFFGAETAGEGRVYPETARLARVYAQNVTHAREEALREAPWPYEWTTGRVFRSNEY